jgi:hypothetical protein
MVKVVKPAGGSGAGSSVMLLGLVQAGARQQVLTIRREAIKKRDMNI